jgi:HEPN domain-containing protein
MKPPHLFPLQEAHEWLRLAWRDIRLAELALGDNPPLLGEALYHAQQAAEKALKGFLVYGGASYPLTHDFRRLPEFCESIDKSFATELSHAAGLTQFAVRFRYPGEDQPTREEALPWLTLARLVFREVERRLTPETPTAITPRD